MKKLIILSILVLCLIAGCGQQITQYVCPDGKMVSNQNECKKPSDCGDSICQNDFRLYYPGEDCDSCPVDCKTCGRIVECYPPDVGCDTGICKDGRCVSG